MSGMVTIWPGDDGTFQVSDGGGWIAGIYDSEPTARAAVPYAGTRELRELSDRVCSVYAENRSITAADLATLPSLPAGSS